jgi:DNA ligase 1
MFATRKSTRRTFLGVCLASPILCWAEPYTAPALMLATVYRDEAAADLAQFWVSEKLDGVRGYWSGEQLFTRAGNMIAAPAWFTRGWPSVPLDGELWGGRGSFERTSGIVRSESARDADWTGVSYRVFDLPTMAGTFDRRLGQLNDLIARARIDWLLALEQERVQDAGQLRAKLQAVESKGGEGLMLHRGDALYVAARTDDLLKYKSFDDAEAKVVDHVPGNGKYSGMLGALLVERVDGVRFKIGSGFTDAERREPPPIGSWITYAHNGSTNSGLPRFARYLRMRSAL